MKTKKVSKDVINNLMNDHLKRIFDAFEKYGFEIRIVGGAVRDILLELEPRDIDLATNAQPTEAMYLLNEELSDLEKMTSWGIRHGTIVIAFMDDPDEQYEITSLDFKIEHSGSKIKISQRPDWESDAKDRDFTVNSMSMDRNGTIYDYSTGFEDIKNERVKFTSENVEEAIKYDPLLIPRFLKLIAKFKNPKFDEDIINIIHKNIDLLSKIKSDTLKWFISNIKAQKYNKNAEKLMSNLGIDIKDFIESTMLSYLKKLY